MHTHVEHHTSHAHPCSRDTAVQRAWRRRYCTALRPWVEAIRKRICAKQNEHANKGDSLPEPPFIKGHRLSGRRGNPARLQHFCSLIDATYENAAITTPQGGQTFGPLCFVTGRRTRPLCKHEPQVLPTRRQPEPSWMPSTGRGSLNGLGWVRLWPTTRAPLQRWGEPVRRTIHVSCRTI